MFSNDFDANQPVQFTYDKRIYKEFPFVGLYLSLCEERLGKNDHFNLFKNINDVNCRTKCYYKETKFLSLNKIN